MFNYDQLSDLLSKAIDTIDEQQEVINQQDSMLLLLTKFIQDSNLDIEFTQFLINQQGEK